VLKIQTLYGKYLLFRGKITS